MKRVLWAQMRRGEIIEARDRGAVVIVPVGATEQHGPHLPVEVDTLCVYSVALRAAEMIDEFPVLVAPSVNYGISPHHMAFPGTITLTLETFCCAVQEICRCIWQHGFRHIFILNGHGGNDGAIDGAVNQLCAEGIIVAAASYWELSPKEIEETLRGESKVASHAGEWETSMLLHLRPESVDMSLAVEDTSRKMPRDVLSSVHGPRPKVRFAWVNGPQDAGLYGDPTVASAETGRKLIDAHAASVAEFVQVFRTAPVPDDWRREASLGSPAS